MVPFSPTRPSEHLLPDPPTDCFAIVFPGSAFHRQQGRNERCENAARLGKGHVPGKRLRSNRGERRHPYQWTRLPAFTLPKMR